MNHADIENILTGRGIRPTPNRILVMKELTESTHPISLADLEDALAPMDKASIFRVLELFTKEDITHVIEDGTRSLKYELCPSPGRHSVADQHAHFYCEKCGATICLDDIPIPTVPMPAAYSVRSINFLFKGLCPECSSAPNT